VNNVKCDAISSDSYITVKLFLNLGARWGRVVKAKPWPNYPQESLGTLGIGGWVGTRAWLEENILHE
jgi:hypothetical protein